MFRVGYRHCFTVDENLICTVRREEAPEEDEEKVEEENERAKEMGRERRDTQRKERETEKEREREREGGTGAEGGRLDGCCLV